VLSHNSLHNYYRTLFAVVQSHQWSLAELENLICYEREIYLTLLIEHIEEENERMEQEAAKMKSQY
tara:strand:- start:38 stop:235 length:198 start_codon:yes stop_codon:yes gene_type:complete